MSRHRDVRNMNLEGEYTITPCVRYLLSIESTSEELDDQAFSEGEEDLSPADYGMLVSPDIS